MFSLRTRSAFVHAFMALLPRGEVWPRDPQATLVRVVTGLLGIVERWAGDVFTFLVVEAFPPTANKLLTDWERVLGLPEPCFPAALTLEERRLQIREKLARRPGGQSRAYFTGIAVRLGYHELPPTPYDLPRELPVPLGRRKEITITEYRPFMCGVSRCGDRSWLIAPQTMRFLWRVTVPGNRLVWFRCGAYGGRTGQDPHLRIQRAEDLECVFRKLKPAHTKLIFDYSGDIAA